MISLEKSSGLPIEMRDDFSLVFSATLPATKPDIREFSAMKNFLKDPGSRYHGRQVYFMYRDLALPEHAEAIHEAGLEYDITVIPPGRIGDEFVKTIGHYHPYKSGTKVRYPEVYEVIYGRAFFLLQSASDDLERLKDAYLVSAERGEKVLVPPGYGHVSVNPGEDVLVMSNWQPLGNKGLYEPYEARSGAAYYVVSSERISKTGQSSSNYDFIANLNYQQVPPLRRVRARELPQYELRSALPMYYTATRDLALLDFLINPEKYLDELTPDKLFVTQS